MDSSLLVYLPIIWWVRFQIGTHNTDLMWKPEAWSACEERNRWRANCGHVRCTCSCARWSVNRLNRETTVSAPRHRSVGPDTHHWCWRAVPWRPPAQRCCYWSANRNTIASPCWLETNGSFSSQRNTSKHRMAACASSVVTCRHFLITTLFLCVFAVCSVSFTWCHGPRCTTETWAQTSWRTSQPTKERAVWVLTGTFCFYVSVFLLLLILLLIWEIYSVLGVQHYFSHGDNTSVLYRIVMYRIV